MTAEVLLQERYLIVRKLGEGGFGKVYQAFDQNLNRYVALKEINAISVTHWSLIEHEVAILAHYASDFAFIPHLYDRWKDDALLTAYLVMEYIDGETLEDHLNQTGPWSGEETERFLRAMLRNLVQLHSAGIIHRDLKPANIKLRSNGHYILLDFGIAKQGPSTLTIVNKSGTPAYAPPEQLNGHPSDARTDLYSLAATAYHLLMGYCPTLAFARLQGTPLAPPRKPGVAVQLEQALVQMLALEPNERPASAKAGLKLLEATLPAALADFMDSGTETFFTKVTQDQVPALQRPKLQQAFLRAQKLAAQGAGPLSEPQGPPSISLGQQLSEPNPPSFEPTAPTMADNRPLGRELQPSGGALPALKRSIPPPVAPQPSAIPNGDSAPNQVTFIASQPGPLMQNQEGFGAAQPFFLPTAPALGAKDLSLGARLQRMGQAIKDVARGFIGRMLVRTLGGFLAGGLGAGLGNAAGNFVGFFLAEKVGKKLTEMGGVLAFSSWPICQQPFAGFAVVLVLLAALVCGLRGANEKVFCLECLLLQAATLAFMLNIVGGVAIWLFLTLAMWFSLWF